MSDSLSLTTNGDLNENANRISALISDDTMHGDFLQPPRDLPIVSTLSHSDPYLSAPSFSVEEFLLSRSHTSLPDLRVELRDYLSTLKEELVQLINDDYAAFISLSTDLRGEGPRLETLRHPLKGLKQEVQASLDELKRLESNVQERLAERSALREEKARLHLLLKLSELLARLESLLLITPAEASRPSDSIFAVEKSMKSLEGFNERSRTSRAKHLSRVAAEFNQLLYYVDKAQSEQCAFVKEIQPRVDKVKSTLFSDLDHAFSNLQSTSITGTVGRHASEQDKVRWKADLKECLQIYDSLGGWREAEEIIHRDAVKPFVQQTIFAGALTVPHSPFLPQTPLVPRTLPGRPATPRTPYTPFTAFPRKTPFEPQFVTSPDSRVPLLDDSDNPLASLYNKILRFIDRDLKSLMEICEALSSKRHQSLEKVSQMPYTEEKFEILSNVIWPEIARALTVELGPIIFGAGRPDDFRQHYATTQDFTAALELMAPSIHSIQVMRSHSSYVAFQKRWQLSVYFQLRWKDIVSKLEDELKPIIDSPSSFTNSSFSSQQASATFEAIRVCWKAEICIPEIGHRFWRLTLQILSRYKTWLDANLPPKEATRNMTALNATERIGSGTGTPGTRSATPIPPQETSEESHILDNVLLTRCGMMISDIKELERKTLELWDNEISVILPDINGDLSPLAALKLSLHRLAEVIPSLASHIITILSKRSCEALTLVRAIPSQYRAMSYKRMPTEPSHFVHDILQPVKSFFDTLPSNVKVEVGPLWAGEIFDAVCQRYTSYLVAMKKTEESLRRLKKGKISAFSLFNSGSPKANKEEDAKDDERIRTQMVLDVTALGDDLRTLGINADSHISFLELKTLASQSNTREVET